MSIASLRKTIPDSYSAIVLRAAGTSIEYVDDSITGILALTAPNTYTVNLAAEPQRTRYAIEIAGPVTINAGNVFSLNLNGVSGSVASSAIQCFLYADPAVPASVALFSSIKRPSNTNNQTVYISNPTGANINMVNGIFLDVFIYRETF